MKFRYIVVLLILLMVSGCSTDKESEVMNQNHLNSNEISPQQYHENGVNAQYPFFVSGGKKDDLKQWNQIINKDFHKILDIYSFQPFPGPTPAIDNQIPTILTINYDTKLNNDAYASFLYRADFNSAYSAHPTDLTYTTNLDKKENKRVKLGDIIMLNKDFVKDFRTWDFIPIEPENEEFNKAIRDYFKDMSDEDLLMGFQNADIIGTGNLRDVYSYMTLDRLGISFGVPNYIGDHVEFEREYDKLKEYLKSDIK